jgi:hypothetical protein
MTDCPGYPGAAPVARAWNAMPGFKGVSAVEWYKEHYARVVCNPQPPPRHRIRPHVSKPYPVSTRWC